MAIEPVTPPTSPAALAAQKKLFGSGHATPVLQKDEIQELLRREVSDQIPKPIQEFTEDAIKRLGLVEKPREMPDDEWMGLVRIKSAGVDRGQYPANWIKALFGKTEDVILTELKQKMRSGALEPPRAVSVGTLDETYRRYPPSGKDVLMSREDKKDAFILSTSAPNGAQMVASQLDGLEAVTAKRADVSTYKSDRTQGPAVSMAAAAFTLWRRAAVECHEEGDVKGLPHAIHECFAGLSKKLLDRLSTSEESWYVDGYLQLGKLNQEEKEELLAHLEKNIHLLRVLPMFVQCQNTGKFQLQIFTAAPSFQSQLNPPEAGSVEDKICRLLVKAQYRAAAQLAVIRSKEMHATQKAPYRLDLTLVGQGAFNNRREVIGEALKAVVEVVRGHNVEVVWQLFSTDDRAKMRQGVTAFCREEKAAGRDTRELESLAEPKLRPK